MKPLNTRSGLGKILTLVCMPEPQFLLPGAVPVVVGTALGFAVTGTVNWLYAFLALVSIVFINAGSNMLNDYFDHLSGNDWVNENVTPFGGGSRYIQNGIVTPRQMLLAGLLSLSTGAALGLLIVALTRSPFILALGLVGVLGGFFWTAPPVRFCYRCIGEPYIFTLFGPLPVFGTYFLQTFRIDWLPLAPGVIIGLIIAMVAEVNSFPDREADAAVKKRTFVVRYGIRAGVWFYRAAIAATFFVALGALAAGGILFVPALLYLLLLPLAVVAMRAVNVTDMAVPGRYRANILTIAYHSTAGLVLSAGCVISFFLSRASV